MDMLDRPDGEASKKKIIAYMDGVEQKKRKEKEQQDGLEPTRTAGLEMTTVAGGGYVRFLCLTPDHPVAFS